VALECKGNEWPTSLGLASRCELNSKSRAFALSMWSVRLAGKQRIAVISQFGIGFSEF